MGFPWNRAESDLDREIAHYLQELTAEYTRQGHILDEAARLISEWEEAIEEQRQLCRACQRATAVK